MIRICSFTFFNYASSNGLSKIVVALPHLLCEASTHDLAETNEFEKLQIESSIVPSITYTVDVIN